MRLRRSFYTNSLKPTYAVVWSGCWNLIGVLLSAGTVAFGILALLPVELVINVGSGAGFAMVFSLLVSAIIWNVGTWYFGLPASSSHHVDRFDRRCGSREFGDVGGAHVRRRG